MSQIYNAFLILEDGKYCQGWSFLDSIVSIGELVFNTGITGYQEIMTDPSYCDQIILFTYPEIGNVGINSWDIESNSFYIQGIVAKNICINSSNWRSHNSLIFYLKKYKIPHIFGVDTRYLTKYIRDRGVMICCIASYKLTTEFLNLKIKKFQASQDVSIINKVTTKKLYNWLPKLSQFTHYMYLFKFLAKQTSFNVVVIDYGVKFSILNKLRYYGCNVIVMPAMTHYKVILAKKPDGILLSNGPGDPSLMHDYIFNIQHLIQFNIPIFGICLGHQLLSLALGAKTHKLKFGHRGLNHPSGDYDRVDMTSQNHGYVVSLISIPIDIIDIMYFNLNDNTISGIVHKYKPFFSVQYHPEASPGPNDTEYLFKHFLQVIFLCK